MHALHGAHSRIAAQLAAIQDVQPKAVHFFHTSRIPSARTYTLRLVWPQVVKCPQKPRCRRSERYRAANLPYWQRVSFCNHTHWCTHTLSPQRTQTFFFAFSLGTYIIYRFPQGLARGQAGGGRRRRPTALPAHARARPHRKALSRAGAARGGQRGGPRSPASPHAAAAGSGPGGEGGGG